MLFGTRAKFPYRVSRDSDSNNKTLDSDSDSRPAGLGLGLESRTLELGLGLGKRWTCYNRLARPNASISLATYGYSWLAALIELKK
jgi:hypothetical protein